MKDTKTKKIVLLVPYYGSSNVRRWNKKKKITSKDIECYPPLSLMYLAGSIKKLKNYEVKILDANANYWSFQELKKEIYKEKPDIVGITVTSLTLNQTYHIINNILKPISTNKPLIIVGGPHITKCPESVDYLGADYGFIGDSEHSLNYFLENYDNKDSIEKIPGIIYRKDGRLTHNSNLSHEDINNIPLPDRSLVNPALYYFSIVDSPFTLMLTSRGCPFNCIYCAVPHKREYSYRNISDVVEEMRSIKERGYEYINICDDVFTLKRDRTVNLCNSIIESEINLNWGCATRADLIDPQLLSLMKKAGCIDVRLGIESGSEEIRKEILGKKISNQKIIEAVNDIKKAGLIAVGFFLIGVPNETKHDIDLTIKLACSLSLDYVSFNLVTPLPGSRLHEIALSEGKIKQEIWEEVTTGLSEPPIYIPDNLDIEYLEKMAKKSLRKFYLRPSYLFSQLLQIRNSRDLFHRITIAKRVLF